MKNSIMFYPSIVLMIVETGALVFLILEWFKAKKEANKGKHDDTYADV